MKLSIITPTHNRLHFLKEAIASVQRNTTQPLDLTLEHVVHDCGSTDGTRSWLETEAKGLIPVFSEKKIPPGRARNVAVEQVRRGDTDDEFLLPLDDDDLLLQRTAHHFVYALTQEATPAQWAVSDFLRMDETGRYLPGEDYYGWRFDSVPAMLQAIFSASHFIQGNVCYRRSLFDRVGGYDPALTMAEDLDLYVRFLLDGQLPRYVPIISHLHRMHRSNTSKGVDKDKYNEDMARSYQKYSPQLRRMGIDLRLIP
ncbi:MAG: glycosyltransferase [Cytophagaceae bacterium]|nr:glycosyltransferase [Cytophagaceae bacterium]